MRRVQELAGTASYLDTDLQENREMSDDMSDLISEPREAIFLRRKVIAQHPNLLGLIFPLKENHSLDSV